MNQKIKITRFDATDYLQTQADINSYLKAAFADGDPQVITRALGDVARAQNTAQLAKKSNVSRAHLYRALSKDGDPRISTVSRIIDTLGYRLAITPKIIPTL
jgi:probable addiction module antidote protein